MTEKPAVQAKVARVFAPLLKKARFKGAWGGRGSGKSHFFAEYAVRECMREPGKRILCVREVQKTLNDSVKTLIEAKIDMLGVGAHFQSLHNEIRTPGGGLISFVGMASHNAQSVKSLEGYDIAWVEEAQTLSTTSLNLLRPTIRKPGSEIWFSWNPLNKHDAVDVFLRGATPPADSVVVRANYLDNPWLTQELIDEAELDRSDPDKYAHIWLGEYQRANQYAYFKDHLKAAKESGRVTTVAFDPLQPCYAAFDIGVSDNTAIWVAQWIRGEIRFIDYTEAQGQDLPFHLNWLRSSGYASARIILPHDGGHRDAVTAIKYEDHVRAAGFIVDTVPNQGRGAAMKRIETARRWFPRMWFDQYKCAHGLACLEMYSPKYDEERQIDLGPKHDKYSHGADAFGLMATAYKEPSTRWIMPAQEDMNVYA